MMHMTFYWGRTVTILFDSWKTDSWLSYFLSLFACFLFALFYQYMEETRLRLKSLPPSSAATPLLRRKMGGGRWAPARLAGAFLFGVNSAIGYLLMLAIMSFNAGVFVAVVVGLGGGYWVFRGGDAEEEAAAVVVDSACACA